MAEDSLSLKYRPKSLKEVIGQDVVVQALENAFKNNTLHHAYIFAGKFGCGKTSVARILAAMENNDSGPSMEPDPKSEICKGIFSGKSSDVRELDAASNRSIDDIRNLAREIKYAPVKCRTKYIIIDEAHSLTGTAAEAALKMIEEPPEGVRFILCTTDPHLLKDTILSRCIVFKFHKVSPGILFQHLKKVAGLENVEYDVDALKIAAITADGSVRNALQNLQTLINYSGNEKITVDAAKQVLGSVDNRLFFKLIDSIINQDAIPGVITIQELLQDGKRSEDVINALYSHLRKLLLSRTCSDNLGKLGFTEEDAKRYYGQSSKMEIETIISIMNSVVDINKGMILNLSPQILLEKFLMSSILLHNRNESRKNNKPTA
jgi:DNA polymerase-3 subunit gamma/tau